MAFILVLASGLRLYDLAGTGIFSVDEGRYYLDAVSKSNEWQFASELLAAKRLERKGAADLVLSEALAEAYPKLGALPPFSPKLGYNYLTALVMTVTGRTVIAASILEAVCGVLLVLVLYFYMAHVCGYVPAVLAALFLACSPYHVYFSRNGYPQTSSGLFFLLSALCIFFWARGSARGSKYTSLWLAACGITAGISFWVNYQAAGALPAIPAMVVFACWIHRGRVGFVRTLIWSGFYIALGFTVVMLAAEAMAYPYILLFRMQGMNYPHPTFFELLFPRFGNQASFPWNVSGIALFPFFTWVFTGWTGVAAAGLACGAGFLLCLRAPADVRRAALLFVIVPLAATLFLFSFKTMQGARMFTYALPFFCGLLGWTLTSMWQGKIVTQGLSLAFGMAILVSAGTGLRDVLAIRSGYPDFIRQLRAAGQVEACAAWSSPLESYLMQENLGGGNIYAYLKEGKTPPRWYISDWQELYNFRYPDEAIAVPREAKPILALNHGINRLFLLVEAFPSSGSTMENIQWVLDFEIDRARKILVYDLAESGIRMGP
ncbi:MAG: hypothetical protein AMXMBFR84_43230 [Candidatus Hydrogenedentota bacterium]